MWPGRAQHMLIPVFIVYACQVSCAQLQGLSANTNKMLILLHIFGLIILLLCSFFYIYIPHMYLWSDPEMLPGTFILAAISMHHLDIYIYIYIYLFMQYWLSHNTINMLCW